MSTRIPFKSILNTTRGLQKSDALPADATSALVTPVDANDVEHSVGYEYVQP